MALKLGAYTACLHDRTLAEALDVLKAQRPDLGGGQHRRVHPVPALPGRPAAVLGARPATEYLASFADRGHGADRRSTATATRSTRCPASARSTPTTCAAPSGSPACSGCKHVVTMSGTPGSDPDAKYPSWVVNPWDGVYMDVLDYQWGVAVEFWTEIDALARENDVAGRHRDAPAQPGVLPGHPEAAGRPGRARRTSAPRWTRRT